MSVMIKGMKMPKCCNVCIFSDWSNLHQTAACKICEYDPCFDKFSKEYLTKRANFCPLVEVLTPHGDLIDRDALNLEYEVEMADDWKTAHEIANCVKYAPVMIEAEGE